ncbi:MAG: glutathione S-transferase N-terminal domain-containing protein [Patescibacteria group bacterium]|nr:glutathione S-transferase N-terminal domain-containing protein [Patescibacteria group bacterium]
MRYVLYVKTGCPYCKRVLEFAKKNGIEFELRNRDDAGVSEELIARGGKRQFPYLVDTENGEEMYESGDIIAYLAKQAGITAQEGSGEGTCAVE